MALLNRMLALIFYVVSSPFSGEYRWCVQQELCDQLHLLQECLHSVDPRTLLNTLPQQPVGGEGPAVKTFKGFIRLRATMAKHLRKIQQQPRSPQTINWTCICFLFWGRYTNRFMGLLNVEMQSAYKLCKMYSHHFSRVFRVQPIIPFFE